MHTNTVLKGPSHLRPVPCVSYSEVFVSPLSPVLESLERSDSRREGHNTHAHMYAHACTRTHTHTHDQCSACKRNMYIYMKLAVCDRLCMCTTVNAHMQLLCLRIACSMLRLRKRVVQGWLASLELKVSTNYMHFIYTYIVLSVFGGIQ